MESTGDLADSKTTTPAEAEPVVEFKGVPVGVNDDRHSAAVRSRAQLEIEA